jgi:cellulose biosynthesis protein BcsQ
LVDGDRQKTAFQLCNVRRGDHPDKKHPVCISTHVPKEITIEDALVDLRDKHEAQVAFVDVGGYHSTAMVEAASFANLWLLPVEPTVENFWGLEDTLLVRDELVAALKKRGEDPDIDFRVVLNRVKRNANKQLMASFKRASAEFPVLMSVIHEYATIPNAPLKGLSAVELMPGSGASQDIRALYEEIMEVIK